MSLFTNLTFLEDIGSNIQEDFQFFEEKIRVSKEQLNNIYTLNNIKELFNLIEDDNLTVFIDDDFDTSKVIFRGISDINTNFNELNLNSFNEDDYFHVRIKIEKKNIEEYKIYSFIEFIQWLSSNENISSLFEKIKIFRDIKTKIKIHILDEDNHYFYTDKFVFYSSIDSLSNDTSNIDRDSIFRNHKDNCHYTGLSINCFSPTDFRLIEKSNNVSLDLLFDKVCFLLTLIYIVNISEIMSSNSFYYKLDGYRSIKDTIEFNNINIDSFNTYYNIFTWVYLESNKSNISDKIGLSRNVISLHITNNDITEVNGDLYTSIKSNFDIYLKENVQRYLEVKNQVSTFMYDMSLKAESYSNSFADIFKTNFLIFISYFISIFLVTAIDKGKFINMFSKEVSSITLIILVMSYVYKVFAVKDLEEKIKRFKKKYALLKSRYSDILEEDNLNSLFTNNEEFNSDVAYMENSLAKFSKLWTGAIIAFSIVTVWLYISNNTNDSFELITIVFFSILGLFLKVKSFL